MINDILSEQHLVDSDDSCLDCDRCNPNSAAIEISNECCATFFPFFSATEIEFKLLLGKDIICCIIVICCIIIIIIFRFLACPNWAQNTTKIIFLYYI